ncbi:alpha/beta fold hydrolase [Yinghuangia sp. ASG 101]|uniref:alpha/beta hydrolase n=1 Tax=Yinghuangia sp. ASG 101 TaxID=2896848 RepID=UPI001E3D8889|nr:alpha/beta fold hydrolase [Yinghuangia sp. ASG 101]UGQ12719.1 alpha/beta fold hydrolase [Yinghuangia sp. ASG 101]
MTAFILVPGVFTGGWVWEEVAEHLREFGARAEAVTLLGEGASSAGADLEAHIRDLLRVVDGLDADDVVLVAHGYGVYPAFGAADRRPTRIARIVCLDTNVPASGTPALAALADPVTRDRVGDSSEDGGRIAPPAPDAWRRWGSTDGLSPHLLDRLTRRAVPQPVRTLTQPLRLSGAVAKVPTTGVLCTANGTTIELVQSLVHLGNPDLAAFVDPDVTFFELATGHWPMLSAPGELADVLRRAAAGEGHRLSAPTDEAPSHLRPFLMDLPDVPRERVGNIDFHLPQDELPCPAIVFVHGGPVPVNARPTPRDWPAFTGYGRYAASVGAVGVTVDHGLHDLADYERAAAAVAEAVESVRAHPRVDGDRVALWFFSAGGLLATDWLAAPPAWLRCVAATYPVLAPLANWGRADSRFRPADALRRAGRLVPIVLTRVGLEQPAIAATVADFLTAADERGARPDVVDIPSGHHGFETIDHTAEAREAVERAMRLVVGHTRA